MFWKLALMATIKMHDFVEIDYTGRTMEENAIFDTTQEEVAKKEGVHDKNSHYHPAVICVGEGMMLKAAEEQLVGKEAGNEYKIEVKAEEAFGRKNAKLLQMIPLNKFRRQNIQPVPGLQLNIDGMFGIVKTVSGGRCYVDFNHPLSGKGLVYDIKVRRIVEDDKEKIKSLLDSHYHMHDAQVELKEGTASVRTKQNIPKEALEEMKNIVKRTIPGIKDVQFAIEAQEIS